MELLEKRIYKCELAIKLGFSYDLLSGKITSPTGKICSKLCNGYILLTLRELGSTYYLYGHQFAWFVIFKNVVELIDHINNNKSDNSIRNLRSTSKSINARNNPKPKGVYYEKRSKKFIAYFTNNYKKKELGHFSTFDEAHEVYINHKNNFLNGINRNN